METRIAYFDETGDDGLNGSEYFILTSLYMPASLWKDNFDKIAELRKFLKNKYNFHIKQEMHTKDFLLNKNPYKKYQWSSTARNEIIKYFIKCIGSLDAQVVNVIIDKSNIQKPDYPILENALKYNIQRIENTSGGKWNFILITDKGRLSPMRKTARKICVYNPIPSRFSSGFSDKPIRYLVEDVFEKDSRESVFIQVSDLISFFVHLYYRIIINSRNYPRIMNSEINEEFVKATMKYFKERGIFNLNASNDEYGLVIYPKKQ